MKHKPSKNKYQPRYNSILTAMQWPETDGNANICFQTTAKTSTPLKRLKNILLFPITWVLYGKASL